MTVISPSDVTVICNDRQFSKWQADGRSHQTESKFISFLVIELAIMDPMIDYLNTQQTPNPEAQFPSAVPDFELHSVEERQVP